MPVKVQRELPAIQKLAEENMTVLTEESPVTQNHHPLKVLFVNLMSTKKTTETQFLRLLGNTPLLIEVTFLKMATHKSKKKSEEHLKKFYRTFTDIKEEKFDGMIVTGAPIEHLEFEEVDYWEELIKVMEWSKKHVASTMYVCWGAQAGLYYHYGIKRYRLQEKRFGVFEHRIMAGPTKLLQGFDDCFYMPHSRYTDIRERDIERVPELEILSAADGAGISIIRSRDNKTFFVTGHLEYDADTLGKEYKRDVNLGKAIAVPENYYPNDDPTKNPVLRWRAHAQLLYTNWLHYYVNHSAAQQQEQERNETGNPINKKIQQDK